MNKIVILLNRDMGITSLRKPLRGLSTKNLGLSQYSPEHRCHIVRMTFEEYLRAEKDIRAVTHLPRNTWTPIFLVEIKTKEGNVDVPVFDYIDTLERQIGLQPPLDVDEESIEPVDDLTGLRFLTLKSIALKAGISVEGIDSAINLRAAIRAAKLQPS